MSFCIIIKSVRDNDCHDSVMHLPNYSGMTRGYIIPLPGVCRCTLSKSYVYITVIDLDQSLGTPWLHSLAFKASLLISIHLARDTLIITNKIIFRMVGFWFHQLVMSNAVSMDTNVCQP